MTPNPFVVATRAKSPLALYQRSRSIAQRYGFTTVRMDHALWRFSDVLRRFDCGATFPITAVTLKRHGDIIAKYLGQNIEFAVHGFTHVDYTQLGPEMQLAHLQRAREIFTDAGITPMGFRSPYLSQNDHLYAAIIAVGFSYVSNQPILWDTMDNDVLTPSTIDTYKRALAFYHPWWANERPSLPCLNDQLVDIPVSLPDDEILIERLASANGMAEKIWRQILSQSYQRGELFTLQLHPERIEECADSLSAVLSEARGLTPTVWCARLDEIAAWWKARAKASVEITRTEDGGYQCVVSGPSGITVLARKVEVNAPSSPWMNGYQEVKTTTFTFKSPLRPFIGLSPSTSIVLTSFLHQQGYIVETSLERERYSYYFDQVNFDANQESPILAQIEGSDCSLIRFGRWPNGAQSALAITGDIDALTLWDYGLRLVGK